MADNNILGKLREKLCVCAVCEDLLNQPKLLPCLHSFCKTCLDEFIDKNKNVTSSNNSFPCPTCHQSVTLTSKVNSACYSDGFATDSFTKKILDVSSALKDDKLCDVCKNSDVTSNGRGKSTAANWCVDCYDAMCETCTKVHLHSAATSDHVVTGLPEMASLSLETIMQRKREIDCSEHKGEVIKMYCMDCQETLCVQCSAISHRSCSRVVTLADAMVARDADITKMVTDIGHANAPQVNGFSNQNSASEVLEETIKNSKERIKSLCEELHEKINQKQQHLEKKLEEVSEDLRKEMDQSGESNQKLDRNKVLKAAGDRMDALLKYGSDVEILNIVDAASKTDTDADVARDEQMYRINFAVGNPVKVFLRDFETLGDIQVEECNTDAGLSSWGVCCTAKGYIIVVDCRNKKVQKFTNDGDLVDHTQLRDEPRDLTNCGDEDVAIVTHNKSVFIVHTSGQMSLKKKIKTEKQYDSIARSSQDDSLLVSSLLDRSVDLITMEGQSIKSFGVDLEGNYLFDTPRYVHFSREGNYVVADVATNSVKCLAPDGSVVYTYHPDGAHVLRKPQGMCCDNIGNVFIADYSNSRIQLITNEGVFQRFVLARESGLSRPVAITMTSANKLIVVQSDGMVKVFSYE